MLNVKVTKTKVKLQHNYIINRGEYKVNPVEFEFTEEYQGLIKKAVFVKNDVRIEQAIINNTCNIPYEVLQEKDFELRVFAYELEGEELKMRYSPTLAKVTTREGSYIDNTGSGEVITPTQFEQYEQALHDGIEEIEKNLNESREIKSDIEEMQEGIIETINEFDVHASEKVIEFNQNAVNKTNEFNENAIQKTNEFNTNADNRTEELNDIAEGIEDMTTAIQFATFMIDDDMHLYIVQADRLKNTNFIFNEETGRLGVKIV